METLLSRYKNSNLASSLVRLGDLAYFDGPLLVLFQNVRNGRLYLFDWVDRNEKSNRWLIYRVTANILNNFINNKISHLELFNSTPGREYYIADIEKNQNYNESQLNLLAEVPQNYFPEKDSYFEKLDCNDFDKIQATILRILTKVKQENEYLKPPASMHILLSHVVRRNRLTQISRNDIFISNTNVQYPQNLMVAASFHRLVFLEDTVLPEISRITKTIKQNKIHA